MTKNWRQKETERTNVERVRSFLLLNLGCTKKEVVVALGLHMRTVSKAIRIIRAEIASGRYMPAGEKHAHRFAED